MATMAETTCRMLLLSFPVLLLLFNVGSVAGDGFLDEINTESVSSLFSSGNLDDAKKAITAASPDMKGAVEQFAASAGAKGDDAKATLNSWAQSPEGEADVAASPELAQAYKDAEAEKGEASWKDWLKGKMSGMGYGSPAGAPAGSPEGAPGPAMGLSSSSESPEASPADEQEAPATKPSA